MAARTVQRFPLRSGNRDRPRLAIWISEKAPAEGTSGTWRRSVRPARGSLPGHREPASDGIRSKEEPAAISRRSPQRERSSTATAKNDAVAAQFPVASEY